MNLDLLIKCIKQSWSEDTAQPHDGVWLSSNPAKGQCAVTSLLLMKHIPGSVLLRGAVNDQDQWIVHYWLLLADDTELDITREQFVDPKFYKFLTFANPPKEAYWFDETNRKLSILEGRVEKRYAKMVSERGSTLS